MNVLISSIFHFAPFCVAATRIYGAFIDGVISFFLNSDSSVCWRKSFNLSQGCFFCALIPVVINEPNDSLTLTSETERRRVPVVREPSFVMNPSYRIGSSLKRIELTVEAVILFIPSFPLLPALILTIRSFKNRLHNQASSSSSNSSAKLRSSFAAPRTRHA